MKQLMKNLVIVFVGGFILYGGFYYWQNYVGIEPAIGRPESDIAQLLESGNQTDMPLKIVQDFKIELFAKDLSGARVLAFDQNGNLWVSSTSEGKITKLNVELGKVISQEDIFTKLRNPHGLAFDPKNPSDLYIAEEDKISLATLDSEEPVKLKKIVDLPSKGGGHFTRTIAFGPDDKLYVSIGSSCNVCNEEDDKRASIYTMNRDGSDLKLYASGLRNTVFFAWSDVDNRMWGADMGRDLLGDNTPPEEINIIEEGKNYGWPICYGKNIHDDNFDKNQYIQDPCKDKAAPVIELPAHSAPLGLDFVPEEGWPREYWYNLIVAYHGSWNSSTPTGYKLVRIILDEHGKFIGTEDFAVGWLNEDNALGRPVDVLIQPGGVMYVSDDKAGVVYKISYTSGK